MAQQTGILLGQYRPLDSFLHRVDARAKLVPVVAVMILSLLSHSVLFYLVILGALIVGLSASGIGVRLLGRAFRPVLLMVAITAAYHLIFSDRSSAPYLDLFGFSITSGGVAKAAYYSLRLLIFVSIAFLVTLTSSPSELAEALTRLMAPLKKVKIPVGELGLVLFMAIRFVPILAEEFTAIRNAQMMRGARFDGSLINRIRKSIYLLIPVFVAALGRADDLATAMEARGYRSGAERSFYSHARLGGRELWFVLLSLSGIITAFFTVG